MVFFSIPTRTNADSILSAYFWCSSSTLCVDRPQRFNERGNGIIEIAEQQGEMQLQAVWILRAQQSANIGLRRDLRGNDTAVQILVIWKNHVHDFRKENIRRGSDFSAKSVYCVCCKIDLRCKKSGQYSGVITVIKKGSRIGETGGFSLTNW